MKTIEKIFDAVERKNYRTLERLLNSSNINSVDEDGRTLLINAVVDLDGPDPAMVKFLIDHGADVNVADTGQKWTALHFAARDQLKEIVKLLLDSGATVDALDVFGNTPLWRCTMNKNPNKDIIRMLLASGADPKRKNKDGISPIDLAALSGDNDKVAMLESR